MNRDKALNLLRLDASATPDELRSAHRRMSAELDEQEENAATDALRSQYRAAREELQRAVDVVRRYATDHSAPGSSEPPDGRPAAPPSSGEAEPGLPAPGTQLRLPQGWLLAGRFEIRRQIGAGELGTVFAALDRERGREIAVRIFPPEVFENEQARERFLREAQSARDLSNPGIVNIYDVATDGDLCFITMELMEGTTLRREMEAQSAAGHRFSVDEAVHVGIALCEALGHAHQRSVHGGVRPECIFLCDDGMVKLTDFGIDRLFQLSRSTMTGVSMGRVSYLAPEQLKGSADVDHRADQYSTAAVLYEMLTGEAPVGRVQSVSERAPDIPRPLSQALDRALASAPADRFANMGAFAQALASGSASPAGRGWFRVAMVAILVLVTAGATFPWWGDSVSSTIRTVLRDPEVQATAETARARALASASTWRKVAGLLPAEQLPDGFARADEAFSAGDTYLVAMDYLEAEGSFLGAIELYESQVAEVTRLLRDEPSRVGKIARSLLDNLEALERELYARAAESFMRLESCEESLRKARTEEERTAIETRRRAAEAELELMNRLKTLTHSNVLSQSLRAEITSTLSQADRQLEEGRHGEALSTYAECTARLQELLAWPGRAESALRERAALSVEIERLHSVLGVVGLELETIQSAFQDAAAQVAQGDEELTGGRVPEAVELFESARGQLSKVMVVAAEGLLLRAQVYDNEGQPAAAVSVLQELLALDPSHVAGRQLSSKILFHRITNTIDMELVFIPPGAFTMGSPLDELGRDEDEGQHPVEITSGFYMGVTEVTQSLWSAVMGNNPSRWEGDELPVEQVSWEEALEFCRRLSDREGRRYRLPTEEEWEYACRGGTTTPFSFGETISTDQANYDGEGTYGSGAKGVFRDKTVPAGTFPANEWGLHDMHGNVWEWCPDSRKDYPPSLLRQSAEEAPIIRGRVLRGGSWRSRPRYCRCANRVRDTEGSRLNNIGFRVVLESE